MSRKTRKRKGSSKAGRPRKEGERYPNGRLKPAGPNERVIAQRKAGDQDAGEHPLDFALGRKWITDREHMAAMAYLAAFNGAHIGGPRLSSGSLCEVIPSEELRMNWSQLADDEITGIFDAVFCVTEEPANPEVREAAALGRWKLLNAALTAEERAELFMVCVVGSWPFWMPKRARDHALGSKDTRKQDALKSALGAVSRALRPAKPLACAIASVPHIRTRAGRSEERVRYVTQDGEDIAATSERGRAFEVTILRKRA